MTIARAAMNLRVVVLDAEAPRPFRQCFFDYAPFRAPSRHEFLQAADLVAPRFEPAPRDEKLAALGEQAVEFGPANADDVRTFDRRAVMRLRRSGRGGYGVCGHRRRGRDASGGRSVGVVRSRCAE